MVDLTGSPLSITSFSEFCEINKIYEFKVIGKADSVKERLEEAKAQIRDKRYGLRLSDKEVITLAIVIVNANKDETHGLGREVAAIEEIL